MNYDEMKAEVEKQRAIYGEIHQKAYAHVKGVYDKYAAKCDGVQLDMRDHDFEYAHMYGLDENGERSWDFSLYFSQRFGQKGRRFELNIGTCGSFNCDNVVQLHLYRAAGVFTNFMKEIETELLNFDWEAFDNAHHAFCKARYALEDYERDEENRKREAKKLDIARKIIVGTKIVTGKHWSTKEPIVEEIDWATDKNVTFKTSYGRRTKKSDVVNNLMCGKWQFA